MTEIDTIALYGPGNLKSEDLVAGFVARGNTLAYFLNELRHQVAPNVSPRHHLIIGQRGMGKTTLLHRIAIAIGEQPELADCFVPLTFREEQYNVINLHVFWRNGIESLLDWLEGQGRDKEVQALENELSEVEIIFEKNRKNEAGGNATWLVFRLACERLRKRPVLFLDNLDLILDALKKYDWGLRDILQQKDGPLVIGAAAAYPKGLSDRHAAFFDFFRITTLKRLETAEVRACLYRLAQKRGEAGIKVTELLSRDPGRIDALTEMTGGNPRTLAVLYLLLESQSGEDAFSDLEKLLDRMTPLYKARAEETAPQARAVLDAVALAWDPITAKQISQESGLDVTAVNAQLTRLENDGYLEKVEVSGSGRSGYQMIERFFNIWYLMRHGSRRLKQRVYWLTAFLRGFYSPSDRENLARDFLRSGNHQGRADVMLALSEIVEDPVYRKALCQAAGQDLLQSEIRDRISRLVDLHDIAPEMASMTKLEQQVLSMRREWPDGLNAQAFWELLSGSLEMGEAEKRKIVGQLPKMEIEKLSELSITLRKEISDLCETLGVSEDELKPYRAALRTGDIHHCYDLQGACAAALRYDNSNIVAVGCLLALRRGGDIEEARCICQRFVDKSTPLWLRIHEELNLQQPETAKRAFARGRWFEKHGFIKEAEVTYRQAITIDPKLAGPWHGLGDLLHEHLGRYEAAEEAYRQAIAIDPKLAGPWQGLGDLLLREHLGRYEEAEEAYRKAIAIDPKLVWSWFGLGYLLHEHLGRYEEAEEAYRKAIAIDPKVVLPWVGLGNLLQDYLNRYEEAETIYLHALEEAPNDPFVHSSLAYLYWFYMNHSERAQHHADLARPELDECGVLLLNTMQALASDDLGSAWDAFNSAMSMDNAELWSNYIDELRRVLRYAVSCGYGPKFRERMVATDYQTRYAPLYWAFHTLLEGEEILRNVNPEIRRTAERLYRGLIAGVKSEISTKKGRKIR